jgi:hypothetical protein
MECWYIYQHSMSVQEDRLLAALAAIRGVFEQDATGVARHTDLRRMLDRYRATWRLPRWLGIRTFLAFLGENTPLREIRLEFTPRVETLYVWDKVSSYVIASSVKPKAYLCHRTAMHLHGLADDTANTLYVNHEQKPVPPSETPLTQQGIDQAFRRKQRVSANTVPLGDHLICLLNGKFTDRRGVVSMKDADGRPFHVSCLERTLIDIAVRPAYAGGPPAVLEAYRRAKERVSLADLASMLDAMEFVYPYHQAVGFYLQQAEWELSELEAFRRVPIEFDFYLAHAMGAKLLDATWRVHYPKNLL